MDRRPNKKDIVSGNIVDILDREGKKRGTAKLIRRNPSKYIQDDLPYIRNEMYFGLDPDSIEDTKCRIWSNQKWIIEWVTHERLNAGTTDSVEVNYFVKVATHANTVYDPMNIRCQGDSSIRFVFLDISVVEIMGEFLPECVSSLNKLWKSFRKPDVVLYYHNQLRAKEQLGLLGMKAKIGGFINPKELTLEEGIREFLDIHEYQDYLIFTNQDIKYDPERTIKTDKLTWSKPK